MPMSETGSTPSASRCDIGPNPPFWFWFPPTKIWRNARKIISKRKARDGHPLSFSPHPVMHAANRNAGVWRATLPFPSVSTIGKRNYFFSFFRRFRSPDPIPQAQERFPESNPPILHFAVSPRPARGASQTVTLTQSPSSDIRRYRVSLLPRHVPTDAFNPLFVRAGGNYPSFRGFPLRLQD